MLLISPPLAKACEPPAGISRLAGCLRGNGLECTLWDANLEGQLYLLEQRQNPADTWSKRAYKNIGDNLHKLRSRNLYTNNDRYQRAVRDINRALTQSCQGFSCSANLADYQDSAFSPHSSSDLLRAAEEYRNNIFFPFFRKRLPHLLKHQADQWIGISVNYLSQALSAFVLAGFLKEEYPAYTLVAGGGLITSWLRSPGWQNRFTDVFDHLVEGPGETALLHLLQQKNNNSTEKYCPPDFTDLPLADYLSPGIILPYNASSGCYWNRCAFCPEKAEGSPYTKLSAKQVCDDLQSLIRTLKPRLIHFLDNGIAPSLMKEMIKIPVHTDWYGFARVSQELCDFDFCRDLRRSGCRMLKLGIESGSQEVLDAMDKGINLQQVEQALQALHRAGIMSYVYLLFGTPAETRQEAQQTLDFTVRNADLISFLNLAVFNLPRNSEERHELQIHDFSTGDLGLYADFIHPRGWNRKAVRRFLTDDFKAHPLIRPILQRDPPFFTSNHAPLMTAAK